MTESAQAKSDVPLEASILDGAVPLESILRTEELYRRPLRPPDYEKENRALTALVSALADSPRTILQTLVDRVLEVLQADSAGLSLLTKDEKRFYWVAIAGAWQPHIGGGTPRDFGPCGDVLDRNIPMLFTHWERRYPYLGPATPLAEEGSLHRPLLRRLIHAARAQDCHQNDGPPELSFVCEQRARGEVPPARLPQRRWRSPAANRFR